MTAAEQRVEQPQSMREAFGQEVFGSDGARGEYKEDDQTPGEINITTAYLLAYATTEVLRADRDPVEPFVAVIGHDPRKSSPALTAAVSAGIRAAGGTVINIGMAPTPAIFNAAKRLGADMSGIVTASHNPAKDNGIKFGDGPDKLLPHQTARVTDRFWELAEERRRSGKEGQPINLDADPSNEQYRPELVDAYVDDVVESIQREFEDPQPLAGDLYVYDGANGAASDITPRILERLGAQVERFACDPVNGVINDNCGAGDRAGVQAFLRQNKRIAWNPRFKGVLLNDGDADRIYGVGAIVQPDDTWAMNELDGNLMLEILADGKEEDVVSTEYVNRKTVDRLSKRGVSVILCSNGDTNVTIALTENNLELGTEFTGHVVRRSQGSSGDGPYIAALLAATLHKKGKTVYQQVEDLPLWPEKMRTIKLEGRVPEGLLSIDGVARAVRRANRKLARAGGAGLTRKSGTEEGKVRIWGNAPDQRMVDRETARIERAIYRAAAPRVSVAQRLKNWRLAITHLAKN